MAFDSDSTRTVRRVAGWTLRKAALPSFVVFALLAAGFATQSASPATGDIASPSPPRLLNLQVFAKRSIQGQSSDYQGPAAAVGGISLNDFTVDGDLSAGQAVLFNRGRVRGFVNSPEPRLSNVMSTGHGPIAQDTLELASVTLDLWSERMARLAPTSQMQTSVDENGVTEYRASASHALEVVDFDGSVLSSPTATKRRLVLTGDRNAQLLVRIYGHRVSVRDIDFAATGGVDPSRIVFFFPDASDLEILSSGGARDGQGRLWNIPGSIVAPSAALHFASSTVTGQVFVQSISAIGRMPSGQVNRLSPPLKEPGAQQGQAFTSSQLLQMVDADTLPSAAAMTVVRARSWAEPGETCQLVCSPPTSSRR